MNFPNFQLTSFGVDAIQQAVFNGSTITFTAVKMGDGTAPSNIKAMTDIVNTKASAEFTSITVADGLAALDFTFDNTSIQSGFYMRELGIMASIDDGAPTLYAYSNSGSNAGYIKPYDSDSYVNLVFKIYVAVGDAEHVTAIISGAVGYATVAQLEAHTGDEENPHGVTKEQVGLGNVPNLAPSDMTISFTQSGSLNPPESGSTLSTLMGALSKAISSLRTHLTDGNNPHSITCGQIGASPVGHSHTLESLGAAAAEHTHSADDIVSGVVKVERGGTGVTSYEALASKMASTVEQTKEYLGIS